MVSSILSLSLAGMLASGALAMPLNKTGTLSAPSSESTSFPRYWSPEVIQGLSTVEDPPAYKKAKAAKDLAENTVYAVSELSTSQINTYLTYTHLAAGAYCSSSTLSTWTCGQHCTAVPGMVVYATGGNDASTPDWYVGYLPSLSSAVVVHQGTTPSSFESLLTDGEADLTGLDSTYFPGLPSGIEVHSGFLDAMENSATAVQTALKQIIHDHGITKVACIGHSLGGAIAILDAVSLQKVMPSNLSYKVVTYGQPRVGNQAWANYVDANISDNTRITHNEDPIPILPGRFLGYVHSSGEKHIDPSVNWWACAGQDNEADPNCSTGEVGTVFSSSLSDHDGPYSYTGGWSIEMGC